MAFIDNDDEEDQNNQNSTSPNGAGAVHLAPTSGVGSVGPNGGGADTKPAGNFATLDKYLNANQGQAAPLADKISSGINNQYNTLAQGNQSTLQGINSQVTNAPGYSANNPDLLAKEAA